MVTVKDLKEYLKSHNVKDDTVLRRMTVVVGATATKLESREFTEISIRDGNLILWTNADCAAAQTI